MRVASLRVLLAALLLVGSGCREGLAFRDDGRLTITGPGDRTVVPVPFRVTWDAHGVPANSRFALLIDRTPPPAGEELAWFARHDPGCERDPGCPDDDYLQGLHVHVTDDTSWEVESVPRPQRPGERELHDVTVILLDPHGRRLGETAATVTVEVQRDG